MKKNSLFAGLLCVGVMFTACESNDPDFNPQTLGEDTQTVTFEGSYWDALIDAPQYGGSQLYGADAKNYGWCDVTTQFTGYMSNAWGGTYGFAEGGSAISNYIDENISEPRDYNVQLAVPVSNGSKNFCVVYCEAGMKFADSKARVIKSMDFIGTTYFLSVAKNGDGAGYARALTQKGDYCNLEITGYKAGEATGLVTVGLAKDGSFLNYWITTDMTTLGAVDSLSFSMDSNDSSLYGMKAPMYVALDNVVIKK
ncbi:MAG: DUF4465 domain-containing protein [Bacteroidaceae bacterium]|nr:DUF4465 domain-containing protein [Bacteroidaceae bacterium]